MRHVARIAGIVAGCVVFGLVMALRELTASLWLRAVIAACAGAVLCGVLVLGLGMRRRT